MNIKNNYKTSIIPEFYIEDIPDFMVITGENGSGKTRLLGHIAEQFYIDTYDQITESLIDNIVITDSISNIQIRTYSFIPAYSFSNNVKINQIINPEYIHQTWGKMPFVYNSYLNLKRQGIVDFDYNQLNEKYLKDILFERNLFKVDHNDKILCDKVYEGKIDKYEPARIEDFIINSPITNDDVFGVNLALLQLKYQAFKDLDSEYAEESPIILFNKVLENAEFNHRIIVPEYVKYNQNIELKIRNINTNLEYSINELSTGEKSILSIILLLFNAESLSIPGIIFLDEPDASLHPSLAKKMIKILKDILVEEKKCKVVITTHSPTTVALCDPQSIYRMDRELGYPVKETIKDAILSLTEGLENITIYFENRKDVFVESGVDKNFYELIYNRLKSKDLLGPNGHLNFVKLSTKHQGSEINGGCIIVKETVKNLSSVDTIFGLIDRDKDNKADGKISIVGQGQRYSIENYILDPIFLCLYLLHFKKDDREKYGFSKTEHYSDIKSLSNTRLQEIIDAFIQNYNLFHTSLKKTYKTISSFDLSIPEEFFEIRGHDLERLLLYKIDDLRYKSKTKKKKNFQSLDEIKIDLQFYDQKDSGLLKFFNEYYDASISEIIIEQIVEFVEFLPIEIVNTFNEIQSKKK